VKRDSSACYNCFLRYPHPGSEPDLELVLLTYFELDSTVEHEQRRQFERAPVNVGLSYSVEDGARWQRASTINLSGGGLRIWSVEEHAPGVQVAVRFRLPKFRRVVQANGRIVKSFFDGVSHDYSHGLAFTQIAEADREAIVEFVKSTRRTANESDFQRAS